jgi:hypothetical protein
MGMLQKDVLQHYKLVFVMLRMPDTFVQCVIIFVAENDMLFQHFCSAQWEYVAPIFTTSLTDGKMLQTIGHI